MRSSYQIIADHYAASERRDLAGMLADLADDVQWTEMAGSPYAGTHVGRQQIIERVFAAVEADWEQFEFRLQTLVDGGEVILGIGDYVGTHRRTGKAMTARVAHVWRLEGGKVQSFEQFADTLLISRAMV
jgi:ketosteroid isomerase-like protein